MKKPFSEKWISDYFVGVFPKEELDKMIDDSVARSMHILEKYGDDVDWQVFFEMKLLKKRIGLLDKIEEIYVTAAD